MKGKLAVNMLTYNIGDSFLNEAIKSVKPYVNEIVIRDTASIQHLGKVWTNSPLDVELTNQLNQMKEVTKSEWILKINDY